jgi:hypothetical protein
MFIRIGYIISTFRLYKGYNKFAPRNDEALANESEIRHAFTLPLLAQLAPPSPAMRYGIHTFFCPSPL